MRGTLWASLNAATEFTGHERRFRAHHVGGQGREPDSIWFGSSNDLKQQAYRSALEVVSLNWGNYGRHSAGVVITLGGMMFCFGTRSSTGAH
jgi:hypothetical protein